MKNDDGVEAVVVECSSSDDDDHQYYEYDDEMTKDCDPTKPNSLDHPLWPQTYRRSMDLLATHQSLNFLGSPRLISPASSSPSPSPKRRRSYLEKPLLLDDVVNQQLLQSQHHNINIDAFSSSSSTKNLTSHSPTTRKSSFTQAVLNGVNLLCGVGLLSTAYAVKEGGWVSLSVLFIFCLLSFYTGLLLRCCLDSRPGLKTYPDIGEAAFGKPGRLVISIILYIELYAACVEYIILESDNLSSLFPNAHLSFVGYHLSSHCLCALMVTLAILPTVWLRNMSILSYISAGGVFVSVLLVICLFWVGFVDNIGFHVQSTKTLNLSTLPVAIGLYGYCYAGHAVLPNIYTSMDKPSQFPLVLLASFGMCTLLYAGVAIMGYTMFGESTESQFTLNLPSNLLASKIAIWATVINPFTKYPFAKFSQEQLSISEQPLALFHMIDTVEWDFHSNDTGHLYFACGPLLPVLWVGNVSDRIFTHNASVIDISLCLFFAHRQRRRYSFSGISLHINHDNRHGVSSVWNIYKLI
ncbi:hypothetical protein QVD17_32409 [Tagetes erecta]|uniref:Amino acid transporter transmembrane domain-containing protein n=1 Tax=Tagetes erecta TaxID=13708 RepID=A0AAD8K7K0_TARER|nr:hypothetical protein QVD17_32409 [Tagetes erecta]